MAAGTVGEGGSDQSRESTQRPNCARSGAPGGGAPAAAAAAKDTTSPYPAVGESGDCRSVEIGRGGRPRGWAKETDSAAVSVGAAVAHGACWVHTSHGLPRTGCRGAGRTDGVRHRRRAAAYARGW